MNLSDRQDPLDVFRLVKQECEDTTLLDYAEPWDYEPPTPDAADWEFSEALKEARSLLAVSPSQFVETSVMMPDAETKSLRSFDFSERPYLRRIYDTPHKRILLKCARQVEKSWVETTFLRSADGTFKQVKDVELGDELVCLKTDEAEPGVERGYGHRTTTSEVTWKSRRYQKPCVRVRTRQGHASEMATTHPVRVWAGWRDASDVRVGDRIAVVRQAGVFLAEPQPESRVRLTAFMIGDGSCAAKALRFTNASYAVLDDFDRALCDEGMSYTFQDDPRSRAVDFQLPRYSAQKLYDWFDEDGLLGTSSYTKFVPDWVFQLSREQTALFLNRLWSTDGHVKMNHATKWSIEYCSMSQRLVLQVQSLLHKFGIPSCIRENWPNIYKKRGEKKLAYILRVETQEGIRAFVREIGALDKIECQELEPWESNSNTDTYPPEVTQLVREVYAAVQPRKGDRTLRSCGIARLPPDEYCLTKDKLAQFVEFFRGDERYDQAHVDLLEAHLDSDVYWDEVQAVEDLGEQWCYDLTVADHHNCVAGAIVTHNSTTLGNRILASSCLIPHFRTLYVSPSAQQTQEFSKTRIRETLETSPDLRKWFPIHLTDNVFEKKAINRSTVTLRYAFLNADRCRGLRADLVALDEIQDILLENIPVIEEAASHSPYRYFIYSGTPKSNDNPIEHYWSNFSTQNEWGVPCERHGTPKDPGSWHWNILGELNIGKLGLICDKCGGPIDPAHPLAQWVRTGSPDPTLSVYEGYRIPQLMVPWIDWKDLYTKYNDYPRAMFFNECLGLSYDSGQRPLTAADIQINCDEQMRLLPEIVKLWREKLNGIPLYGGIDWGQDSTKSHTVMKIGGYYQGRFRVIYAYRFIGADTDIRVQMDKICRLIDTFQLARVGVDYGGGLHPNDELLRKYGSQRIVRFQYSTPSVFMKWDSQLGRYIIHRSEVMSAIFNAIKRGTVYKFPAWKDFAAPYAADMLSIFSEYNEHMHMTQYKKSSNNTDDSFHALLFLTCVSMLDTPRPDIFVPSAAIDRRLES